MAEGSILYKDKEKQREANKQAKVRYKARQAEKNAPGCPTIDELKPEGIPTLGIPLKVFQPQVQAIWCGQCGGQDAYGQGAHYTAPLTAGKATIALCITKANI